jgi:C4-dicarboxylate-specific signal transduction histidine kinase
MEQLGKPFVQDRAQLTSNNEGIGLGLAISIALAERMGGRLRFTNRAEGGLEARLTLPAA